ncbi:MAG: class I SAM-dependent methyltransferase [Bacteroidetes bacterium]|nr:class I SAM-dependent methyltransferase [Bacteroidota bacterium]
MNELIKNIRDKALDFLLPDGFYFSHKGHCTCCDQDVTFQSYNSWLRDSFRCSNCLSVPRERALMLIIELYYPAWRSFDIHESSPSQSGASLKLQNSARNYVPSQYFPDKPFGTMVGDFQNQDLENQTFPDESFDLVVTQDVMEHLYDPGKAFAEIARTLKKGGAHIFTVPLIRRNKPTEIWAVKGEDNNPVFLKTPEWHENPVDPNGSAVTMHWGFDIVDFIREKSGLETTIEYIDNLDYGIRAELIEVVVSQKSV